MAFDKTKYYNSILEQLQMIGDDIDRQVALLLRDNHEEFIPPSVKFEAEIWLKAVDEPACPTNDGEFPQGGENG